MAGVQDGSFVQASLEQIDGPSHSRIAFGVPDHFTQLGHEQRFIVQEEAERKVYLDLLGIAGSCAG